MVKNKLLDLRLKLGYKKQQDFAAFLGITKAQYNKYENNKEQPSIKVLYAICKKVNIKMDDLIYEELEN